MTRNADLDCEDLRACDHSPETPVSEGHEIVAWICRCGQREHVVGVCQCEDCTSVGAEP